MGKGTLLLLGILACFVAHAEHTGTGSEPRYRIQTTRLPPGPMPHIVVITSGYTRRDSAIASLDEEFETLARCGIRPNMLYDDAPHEALIEELKKEDVPADALYYVGAHGEGNGRLYSVQSTKDGWQSGDDFVRALEAQSPRGNVFLSTCHAGAALDGRSVAVACQMDEETRGGHGTPWSDVSRLMCDGYNGDCSLWNQWDANSDGKLGPEELNRFFQRKSTTREVETRIGGNTVTEARGRFALYQRQCQGTTRWVQEPKHTWMIESPELIDAREKRVIHSSSNVAGVRPVIMRQSNDPYEYVDQALVDGQPLYFVTWKASQDPVPELESVDTAEEANVVVRRLYPDWPARCGQDPQGNQRRRCRLLDRQVVGRAACRSPRGGYDLDGRATFQPQSRGFTLTADRCAVAWTRGMRPPYAGRPSERLPQTGLQIRSRLE